ncbi:putative colanic acid biosynthesis acetyltransferase [Novosphingobium sp. TH158]|uniref:putative colanic acid biosynthesis acetyltransferase n=1 Tax=Novosphingobium sp. TH158 TaxID=2067455 RepID=UPI000C7C0074|nr:putative colanic acid biosynthesis acetyltransferase [Novosphingobium sp. TH158]PLK27030.1 putative colanic acid biosynthesis acetyltransferase [Novosphingobium sp. TH158]
MTLLDASQTKPLEGGPSFSLGNRLARIAWMAAWLVLARFTPPPLHGWRRLVLRMFGARVGKGARVHASVAIWWPGNLELGEYALVGPGARIYNQGHIAIGARSVISQRAHLCASTHDIHDPDFQLVFRPIAIGKQCWVAAEAFVGPGVTMGDRAVLGARGVLFEDAEADGVYSGNPARLIKQRNLRPGRQAG